MRAAVLLATVEHGPIPPTVFSRRFQVVTTATPFVPVRK